MNKHNQDGAVSGVAISLVFTILLLIGSIAFGAWAYTSRQDYKDNSDAKSAAAAEAAKQAESKVKDKQFAEESKNPLRTYISPESTGSVKVAFPKTWSGYVADTSTSNQPQLDGYFAPNVVPSKDDQNSVFALRIQLVDQSYSTVVNGFSNQQKQGKLTVSAYALPKLPKVVGVKTVGQLTDGSNVTMVVFPLRSQTLEVWTEGNQYLNDFNTYILPNLTFSP